MDVIFQSLVVFTIFQRIFELFISKKNEKYLKSLGAKIISEPNYIFMVILHSSWLALLLYYAFFTPLIILKWSAALGILLFMIGQALRITAILTLGKRWSTRIAILPEVPAVKKGIYNYIRHPNYLGVILELFALPMIAGLYKLAFFISLANFIILFFRIKEEENALAKFNNYNEIFKIK